jgi:hypothetical protein
MWTYEAEKFTRTGVSNPMRTKQYDLFNKQVSEEKQNLQLFVQLLIVLNATPLLLMERGKTSLGRTHPIGPNERP